MQILEQTKTPGFRIITSGFESLLPMPSVANTGGEEPPPGEEQYDFTNQIIPVRRGAAKRHVFRNVPGSFRSTGGNFRSR